MAQTGATDSGAAKHVKHPAAPMEFSGSLFAVRGFAMSCGTVAEVGAGHFFHRIRHPFLL